MGETSKKLLEKVPADKCWAIGARILNGFLVLSGSKILPSVLGMEEGIISPVWGWEKHEEATPTTFTTEQLQSLSVPVLLILGENDNLVGDPERVKEFAQNVTDIQIEVLKTGHGIWIEQPDYVNNLIYEFFEQS